jgi:hypothetical protein
MIFGLGFIIKHDLSKELSIRLMDKKRIVTSLTNFGTAMHPDFS